MTPGGPPGGPPAPLGGQEPPKDTVGFFGGGSPPGLFLKGHFEGPLLEAGLMGYIRPLTVWASWTTFLYHSGVESGRLVLVGDGGF